MNFGVSAVSRSQFSSWIWGESTVPTERWYLHLSGARMARTEFPPGSFDETNYSMGVEDFVFQLLQIVSTGHERHEENERYERYEGQRVKVEVWLWGGTMFLNPAPEYTWYKAFESTGVSLQSGKDLSFSAKFADRFTLRLKLHPLYSQVSRHEPSEANEIGEVPHVCEEGIFRNTGRPPVSFVAAGGMAVVFIDYSEPEFDDFSARVQMRLCVCPCISSQVLQAVTLQAVPNDSVGEKHLTWTWSANSTRLRSATERLLTVELRLPREATKTGSQIGSEPSKQTKAFNAFNAFNSKLSTPSVYAPQLWLKAVVLQAGEAVDHIDEELILPVTIVQFLRPLDCSEQQLQVPWKEVSNKFIPKISDSNHIITKQERLDWLTSQMGCFEEYWEDARHFMYILDIPHEPHP